MTHKICFKATTKEISVLPLASEVPVGFTNIGNYIHDAGGDPLGSAVSHVLYHHIRDALYPLEVQDMAYINVSFTREIESVPVIINCAYPLDATLAEIEAIDPLAGKPVMSNGDQTGTVTLTGAGKNHIAAPTAIPSGRKTVRFDSGVKTFEFDYAMPDFSGATVNEENICYASLSVADPAKYTTVVYVEVFSGVLSDLAQSTILYIHNSTGVVAGSNTGITIPRAGRIAFRMDSATGTFEVETAAGVVVLSDDTYSTSDDCVAILYFNESDGAPAEHAGKTMSASLVTDLAQMLYPLPDGATDICGNAL